MADRIEVTKAGKVSGVIRPPSDKSLTHRAYIFGVLAQPDGDRTTTIKGALGGEDCLRTRTIFSQLGCKWSLDSNGLIHLFSKRGPFIQPEQNLECGNSGTTIRLLTGVLAPRTELCVALQGDASLSKRPMKRVTVPLNQMGADIQGDTPPLQLRGQKLNAIDYATPVASAQIKSALLFAGLEADGTTWVTEPSLSRDHTERMLTGLGVTLQKPNELRTGIEGGQSWKPFHFEVPGDISSSAFWIVLAACVPNAQITLQQVGVNPTRTGILDVLQEAGITYALSNQSEQLNEPRADITIYYTEPKQGFHIAGDLVPRLIDEIPVLAVLATQCEGRTVIHDAQELKVKESDRLQLTVDGLKSMGADIEATTDGMIIQGPTPLKATQMDAHGDHRIAMAFCIAGLLAEGTTVVTGTQTIATSYPSFMQDLKTLV